MSDARGDGTGPPPRLRLAGAACVAAGAAGLLANVAILKFLHEYWAVLFLMGPPLVLGGAVLALLPAKWASAGSPGFLPGRLILGLALLLGLLVGAFLAWDPLMVLGRLGLGWWCGLV
jgi:hypothetical protein